MSDSWQEFLVSDNSRMLACPTWCGHMTSFLSAKQKDLTREQRNKLVANILTPQALALPLISKPPIGMMYGKMCYQKRDIAFFTDLDIPGYKYSGQMMATEPLSPHKILVKCLAQVNKTLQLPVDNGYNAILVNRYNNGEEYLSAHSDAMTDLDSSVPVVSIAFGAQRIFRIRDKRSRDILLDYVHPSGGMVIMDGDFQDHYLHEIPVQKRVTGSRVSFTFRKHLR